MDSLKHDSPEFENQVLSPEWEGARFAVDSLSAYINERAPKLNVSTWWQRAFENAHAVDPKTNDLAAALTLAGAPEDEANVASNIALMAARCERFRLAGDLWKSIASGQTAYMYAGFLLGMSGFMPEALEAIRAAHESDPDKLRGRKVAEAASKGGEIQSKWPERAEEMQAAIDAIHAENPSLSYEDIKRRAYSRHAFPLSALKRYTTNPKKS